jgi:hypothetical protein
LFSVDPALSGAGTPENNKERGLRAFTDPQYRATIDLFLLPSSQRQKKKYLFFALSASLR